MLHIIFQIPYCHAYKHERLKKLYQVPKQARFNVPNMPKAAYIVETTSSRLTNDQRSDLTKNNKQCARATRIHQLSEN